MIPLMLVGYEMIIESLSDDVTKTKFMILIMGFVNIFGKSTMKNAYLQKISILVQIFGGKILALLCSDDSIQILLILSQFQM